MRAGGGIRRRGRLGAVCRDCGLEERLLEQGHTRKGAPVSRLDPHSRTALLNRWTALDWKTVCFGLVMLVAVAFSLDNLFGAAYLDAGALRWDIGQHLLDLVPDFGFKPFLP